MFGSFILFLSIYGTHLSFLDLQIPLPSLDGFTHSPHNTFFSAGWQPVFPKLSAEAGTGAWRCSDGGKLAASVPRLDSYSHSPTSMDSESKQGARLHYCISLTSLLTRLLTRLLTSLLPEGRDPYGTHAYGTIWSSTLASVEVHK